LAALREVISPLPMPETRIASLRNAFITGLLLLAPLAVTIWAFRLVIEFVGGRFRPIYNHVLPESISGLTFVWDIVATLLVVVLITLFGYISRLFLGRFLLGVLDRFLQTVPGLNTVYNTVKQVIDTFGSQSRQMFSKVVLVQFPRPGVYSIGFLTNKAQGEPQEKTQEEVWTVFVPTTPNPTSGFLIMLPKRDIVELEMSVGDGMKMVISGGAVTPPSTGNTRPPIPR
jgi:uncharacterized membrane protein